MAEGKRPVSFTVPQLAALVPLLLAAGTGLGWVAPKNDEKSNVEALIEAKEHEWAQASTNKMVLDSIGRVASSVSSLHTQVSQVQASVEELTDSMNAMCRRAEGKPAQSRIGSLREYTMSLDP